MRARYQIPIRSESCKAVRTEQSSGLAVFELVGDLVLALLDVELVLALKSDLTDSPVKLELPFISPGDSAVARDL